MQLQLHYTNYTTQLQLHYITTTATAALHHTTSSSCGWGDRPGDHCNHCNHSKKHSSNHLSVHQWIRSAIRDSQQPISPIGFLFLKLPPPPCAALLANLFFMAMSPDIPLISMVFCGTVPLFYLLVLSRAWGNDPCSLATIIPFSHSSMFRVLNFPSRWSAVYLGTWYRWTAGAGAGHKSSIHISKRWRITTWNSDYEMMHTVMLESIHLVFLIECLD